MSKNHQLPQNHDNNKDANIIQNHNNNNNVEEDLFDEILFFNVKELLGNKLNPSLSKYLSTISEDMNVNTTIHRNNNNTTIQNTPASTLNHSDNPKVAPSNLPHLEEHTQLDYNVEKTSTALLQSSHHISMFDPFYYIDSLEDPLSFLDPIMLEQSESILPFDHLSSQPLETSSISSTTTSTTSTTTSTSNHFSLTSSSSKLLSSDGKKRLKSELTTSSSTLSYLQSINPKDRVHTPTIRKEGKNFDYRKKCIHCRLHKTKFYCIDCNVPLCLDGIEHNNCWYNYHLKLQQSK